MYLLVENLCKDSNERLIQYSILPIICANEGEKTIKNIYNPSFACDWETIMIVDYRNSEMYA